MSKMIFKFLYWEFPAKLCFIVKVNELRLIVDNATLSHKSFSLSTARFSTFPKFVRHNGRVNETYSAMLAHDVIVVFS